MLYELRAYQVTPGNLPALNKRFADHGHSLFLKHGMHVVGYWTEPIGDSTKLNYILGWNDLAEMDQKRAAFQADPDWQRVREEAERNGPLVARIQNTIWRPTAYSPMQ